ncbi:MULTISPECIES: hypothetical protein [unclassified Streptomyces]|uniref:hypothetical protein n=1 Tax=unclassified Streptomyces TaxID=2593676 RepID=UPI0033FBA5F9
MGEDQWRDPEPRRVAGDAVTVDDLEGDVDQAVEDLRVAHQVAGFQRQIDTGAQFVGGEPGVRSERRG